MSARTYFDDQRTIARRIRDALFWAWYIPVGLLILAAALLLGIDDMPEDGVL
jgi:hypothetical protein